MDSEETRIEVIDAALGYARLGWAVLPMASVDENGLCRCTKGEDCQSSGKHPLVKWSHISKPASEEQIVNWWSKSPHAGLGILTGGISGIFVLDVDDRNGGYDSLYSLEQTHGSLPNTVSVKTGGGGQHYYFRANGLQIPGRIGLRPGIDIKGERGYVVAPPSLHKSGRVYEWDCHPDEVQIADPPEWLIDLIIKTEKWREPEGGHSDETIPEGKRNATLTSLAGTMRRRSMSPEAIQVALLQENQRRCRPPLDEKEVEMIVKSISSYEPSENGTVTGCQDSFDLQLTEVGLADLFIHIHGAQVRYIKEWNRWLVFDGIRWTEDQPKLESLADLTVRYLLCNAANDPDHKKIKRKAEYALKSLTGRRIREMLFLARSREGVAISNKDLDMDPWLLNVKNGTIDLKTGTRREHRPGDLITKLASVEYDPDAVCPEWLKFLDRIMRGNLSIIEYLSRCLGYALTGEVKEHVLFFLYGTGRNGKTTFLNCILSMLGDYAGRADRELLIERKGAHPTSIANLFGKRFVCSSEISSYSAFDEALLKELTGGDRRSTRLMRQDWWEYDPTDKIFIAANHKPSVRETTVAFWARIHLIPYTERIPTDEIDKNLPEKLREELPGILAWAVRGCLMWQKMGLNPPDDVLKATEEYSQDEDILGPFLAECTVMDPQAMITTRDLYKSYQEWCANDGEKEVSTRTFRTRLSDNGFKMHRTNKARGWIGLRLISRAAGDVVTQGDATSDITSHVYTHEGVIPKMGSKASLVSPVSRGRKNLVAFDVLGGVSNSNGSAYVTN